MEERRAIRAFRDPVEGKAETHARARARESVTSKPARNPAGGQAARMSAVVTAKRKKYERRKRKKPVGNARDVNESPGTSRVSWPKAKL